MTTRGLSRLVATKRLFAVVVFTILMAPAFGRVVSAHPFQPGFLSLEEQQDGSVSVLWRIAITNNVAIDVVPVLPNVCAATSAPRRQVFQSRLVEEWTVDCGESGLTEQVVSVEGLEDVGIDVLVRVRLMDGQLLTQVLSATDSSFEIEPSGDENEGFLGYLSLGINHILGGFDHLLFVFGLLLLVLTTRLLLATITFFTIGHSITLALATFGLFDVPTAAVDATIALSILLLAVELAHREMGGKPTLTGKYPWVVAGCFGLLHGCGFARALLDLGLPEGEIPLALFLFNVGVEVGQIAFVVLVFPVLYFLRRGSGPRPFWARWAPIYVIGVVAAVWCFQRMAVVVV